MQIHRILCAKHIVRALPLHVFCVRKLYAWLLAYYRLNFARTHLQGQIHFMSIENPYS